MDNEKRGISEDFGQMLSSNVEERVKQGLSCFDLTEEEGEIKGLRGIKELTAKLRESGVNLEVFQRKLPSSTYDRQEAMRSKIKEALRWSDDRFFVLVEEVISLPGGEIGEIKPAKLREIREKMKTRGKQSLKTAGEDWKEFSSAEKDYIYRSLGVLECLYDTLFLCRVSSGDKEFFLEAAKVFSANITPKLIRGEQRARGVSQQLQQQGIDYEQARLLPPGGYTRIIKALFSSPPYI
jgi:hypothetical protein